MQDALKIDDFFYFFLLYEAIASTKNACFAARRARNCKSLGKTNGVLQEALFFQGGFNALYKFSQALRKNREFNLD